MKYMSAVIFALASVPLMSYAGEQKYERKYTAEVCEKTKQGKVGECQKLDYVLKVDYSKKNVAINIYHKGEFMGNTVLQFCKFFDAETWNCPDGSGYVAYSQGELRMKVVPDEMTVKFTRVP
jgi:hypothetical protein